MVSAPAALTESRAEFETFIRPLHAFVNHSPNRAPLTDWLSTTDARQIGFQARPVVGGVYLPLLRDVALWRKWALRAKE